MNDETVTDVTPKASAVITQVARLASVVSDTGHFCVGAMIVQDPAAAPEGRATLHNALTYDNLDAAIAELQAVLAHARQFRDQVLTNHAYQEGYKAAQAQAATADVKPAVDMPTAEASDAADDTTFALPGNTATADDVPLADLSDNTDPVGAL